MTSDPDTRMYAEAREAADAAARFLAANDEALGSIAADLRASPPAFVVTCARGSSDHAATYGKYLFETMRGVPTASAALSAASVFGTSASTAQALCIAISQSGRSPDLLRSVEAMKQGGARTIALVNDETAPLAGLADRVLPLRAGPETSVAATKSFIAAATGLVALAACWGGDQALGAAVAHLPQHLRRAFDLDWSKALPWLEPARNLFVVGRGYGLGMAQEAALKLKETCGLHAEAFSAAEVRHGPMAIVNAGFPVLAFAGSDAAGDSVRSVVAEFRARGAQVALCDTADRADCLPALATHPAIEPLLMIQSFYRFANQLSVARGFDPDAPPHLAKVTRTL